MSRVVRSGGALLMVVVALPSCQAIGGFKDFSAASTTNSGGASASGGTSSSGGASSGSGGTHAGTGGVSASGGKSATGTGGTTAAACSTGKDPGKHGPEMGQFRRPDGSCFWIDSTEVNAADYAAFLKSPHSPQSGACSGNTLFDGDGSVILSGLEPPPGCSSPLEKLIDGGSGGDLPMTCVDWCDALAFCVWAGKDLCRDDFGSPGDGAKSDWYQACSGGSAANSFGCTATSCPLVCNAAAANQRGPVPVGSETDCYVTSANGVKVHDLSGNVSEWTDSCNSDLSTGACVTRGGDYASDDNALECIATASVTRSSVFSYLGFRCCADPIPTDGG
jgi:sulfatase modifying factor 1